MRRAFEIFTVLVLALVVLIFVGADASAAAQAASSGGAIRLSGSVLPALSHATRLAHQKPSSILIDITLVLRRDDQKGFEEFLHSLYDPKSPNYHHFLSQEQIAARFGPSRADYESVLSWLEAKGFTLVTGSKNRLTITVRGTRAIAERAMRVKIDDYRFARREFFANDRDPTLPRSIAPRIQAVAGLSNLARPRHSINLINSTICNIEAGNCAATDSTAAFDINTCVSNLNSNGTYNVTGTLSTCTVYGLKALRQGLNSGTRTPRIVSSALDGTGQTIGLVEFDTYHPSDVANYLALSGQPASEINQLSEVAVNGGVATPGPAEDEVLLDIDTTLSIAPGAKTVVYDAPFTGGGSSFQAVLNQMISDGVTIISNSWAYCENQTSSADVNSIDAIFQNAAAAGISVFNGTGDTGSTCLDGSPNTISVPADSPNATAVGGSSEDAGPAFTYSTESWWDDAGKTPPAGQGGFGTSKFFSAPTYQNGLSGSNMRSIPDVVINADPFHGVEICQADAGGCPTGQLYGGTSIAAPRWAALTALMNQALGRNLGFLNPLIYPFADSAAFHDATALSSDFLHVGLGSPNFDALELKLSGQAAGSVDPDTSAIVLTLSPTATGVVPDGVYDDGQTEGNVTVFLADSNGHSVGGKTVKLTASAGSAQISPASGTTSDGNGAVTFQITDNTAETISLSAEDTTDAITLPKSLPVTFVAPPATSVGLSEIGSPVKADGVTTGTVTVTMDDAQNRPTPGKLVQISQGGGHSVIVGPNPPVTDSNGQIVFTVSDTDNETVTYSATDVTDGNLPFPSTTQVTFNSSANSGCASGMPTPAPGYVITPVATGFEAQNVSVGGIGFPFCPGASVPAFDSAGNMYVSDFVDGNLYKFPPSGGVAGAGTVLASIGETAAQPVFSGSNLWVVRAAAPGSPAPSTFFEVDTTNGSILNQFTGVFCSSTLAADPLSGDLFSSSLCGTTTNLWYSTLASPQSFSVYAGMPDVSPASVAFLPGGTMFVEGGTGTSNPYVEEVSGTNVSPTTTTQLAGLSPSELGLVALGSGNTPQGLIMNIANGAGGTSQTVMVDLTTNPPTIGPPLTINSSLGTGFGGGLTIGPDGCLYGGLGNAVYKLSKSDGSCPFTNGALTAALSLSPAVASPNPAQGAVQTLTASLHFATAAAGTPVSFQVTGANPFTGSAVMDSNGNANFSYVGRFQGVDTITASTSVGGTPVTSNPAIVSWGPGLDTTFLTLNGSPTSATQGQSVTLVASLTDSSQKPPTPIAGQTVNFAVGDQTCSAATNSSGIATCSLTPSGLGIETMAANFAGSGQYVASSASASFNVAQPTVTGKLKIHPKRLNFGTVAVGSGKTRTVKIVNKGKITKKKTASPIIINAQSATPDAFQVTDDCSQTLNPKARHQKPGRCTVTVKFTPTASQKYTGTLTIYDNLEPDLYQTVQMIGKGK